MQLAHLLASMRDETGHILIENYYDDVTVMTEAEQLAITAMPDIGLKLIELLRETSGN